MLTRQRYNEDQGSTEREVGYRKGWNDHARHMLRLLADREVFEIVAALCDTIEDGRVRK